jgi:hypothetical protein
MPVAEGGRQKTRRNIKKGIASMHLRRGCWLANTHYLEGLDTLRIYCFELLNGRWQKRVGNPSGFRSLENHRLHHPSCCKVAKSPGKECCLPGPVHGSVCRVGYESR